MDFLTTLAWIFSIGCGSLILLKIVNIWTYDSSRLKIIDTIHGVRRKWSITWELILLSISIAWLISN